MPHAEEHPLPGRFVVPNADTGERVYVIDWVDRRPQALGLLAFGADMVAGYRRDGAPVPTEDGIVLVSVDYLTRTLPQSWRLVHHAERPSYDPVPVGVIS